MRSIVAFLAAAVMTAQASDNAARHASASYGYAVKKPLFSGACYTCPLGAIGLVIAREMKPLGYDVTVCTSCNKEGPFIVAERRIAKPVPRDPRHREEYLAPSPPSAEVDFGSSASGMVLAAYRGTGPYVGRKPQANLRLLGTYAMPMYLVVATTKESRITDLAQLRTARNIHLALEDSPATEAVLAYYGVSKELITANGGKIVRGVFPDERKNLDVVITFSDLTNAPEWSVMYDFSGSHDLNFIELPAALLTRLATDPSLVETYVPDLDGLARATMPFGLFRGLTKDMPTVVRRHGISIYTRSDVSDQFAYDVAKAMDEHQDELMWSPLKFYYNSWSVAKSKGVPLHPGAARYYSERGYPL